jgi:hypothetical protein
LEPLILFVDILRTAIRPCSITSLTVFSWAAPVQDTLDLLIEPQRGLTRELLNHAKRGYTINPIVMFSGPHGMDLAMDRYESVLMVASGFSIAALLPYLKKLIHVWAPRSPSRRGSCRWPGRDTGVRRRCMYIYLGTLGHIRWLDGCITLNFEATIRRVVDTRC